MAAHVLPLLLGAVMHQLGAKEAKLQGVVRLGDLPCLKLLAQFFDSCDNGIDSPLL